MLSAGETDVDCGGICAPCSIGFECVDDIDCQMQSCVESLLPSGKYCFPPHVFSRVVGDPADQRLHDAVLAPDGSVIIVGHFEGSMVFETTTLTSQDGADAFAAKLNPFGTQIWARSFPGPSYQTAREVQTYGEIPIVAGAAGDAIDLGEGPLTPAGANDLFVAALGNLGSTAWGALFGGTGHEVLGGLAISNDGLVALGGIFHDATDLGTGEMLDAGEGDGFLAIIDQQGQPMWAEQIGGTARDWIDGVAWDDDENLFVLGRSEGALAIGGDVLAVPTAPAFRFVVKLDGVTKQVVWSRTFPLPYPGLHSQIGTTADGDLVLAGVFNMDADFGTGPLSGEGDVGYIAKMSGATGITAWVRTFDGGLHDRVLDFSLRGSDIFILAQGSGSTGFGHPHLEGTFLVSLDTAGAFRYGFPTGAAGDRVDVVSDRGIISGNLLGIADFGGGWLVSNNGSNFDVFVAQLIMP